MRVYSAAKTVADCFKYRNKVGVEVAVEALRDFSRRHRGGATELARYARICRAASTPHWPDIGPSGLSARQNGGGWGRTGSRSQSGYLLVDIWRKLALLSTAQK